jgi:hypothetical protein
MDSPVLWFPTGRFWKDAAHRAVEIDQQGWTMVKRRPFYHSVENSHPAMPVPVSVKRVPTFYPILITKLPI